MHRESEPSKEAKQGANFIHKQNPKLQLSKPVQAEQDRRKHAQERAKQAGLEPPANTETSQKPAIRLSNWFEVLERTHLGRGASEARQQAQEKVLERIKDSYHKLFVVKPQDIPSSVFEAEVRQVRERGDGDIPPYEEFKQAKIAEIISAQESSLDRWVDYLTSTDADAAGYPMWARYWAFMAVTKMGKIEKHQHEDGTVEVSFNKRDEHTVAPFPLLNAKALAQTFEAMAHQLEQLGLPKAERQLDNTSKVLSDEQYASLLSNGNFIQLYGQFLAENPSTSIERLQETRGEWKCYPQGSDATPLFRSLQDHTLEWCTAGAIETAQGHVNGGDFYVYYSLDEYGEPTIPRIAIRKEDDRIVEIRGIEHDQHLDPYIGDVLDQQLQDSQAFPNAQEYLQGTKDMAKVTELEARLGARYNDSTAEFLGYDNPGAELTLDDLRFLYELDHKIVSLGYGRDPRIDRLLGARDKRVDLSHLFGVLPEQISLNTEEALSGNIRYHYGDLDLDLDLDLGLGFDLRGLISAKSLKLPRSIGGGLNLGGLTSAEGLELPQSIGGALNLGDLTSAEGLKLPRSIGDYLDLHSLTSAEDLELPRSIGGGLNLGDLTSAEGLELPQSIGGSLGLNSLTSAEGLELPQSIGGGLYLYGLTSAEGLELPQSIGGSLGLDGLTSAEGLELPQSVGGDLYLGDLTSAEGLELPQSIGGGLYLGGLTSAEGLELPHSISGGLYLGRLTSAEGLELPQSIDGSLDLNSLTSAEGLELPQSVGGGLNLNSLISAEGLELPQSVGGDLYLDGLTSAEDLELPQSVGGGLYLGGLTSAEKDSLRQQRLDLRIL